MPSRLSQLADRTIEAGWLVILTVTPLLIGVSASRHTEPHAAAVLSALVVAIGLAWLVRTVENRTLGVNLLVLPVFLYVGAQAISAATSIAPHLSIWGSWERAHGLTTTLSLVGLFLAVASTARSTGQIERGISTALLAGLVVAFEQLLSRFGILPGATGLADAASGGLSTFGGPAYGGGLLVMTTLLGLGRIVASVRQVDEALPGRHRGVVLEIGAAACVLVLVAGWVVAYVVGPGPSIAALGRGSPSGQLVDDANRAMLAPLGLSVAVALVWTAVGRAVGRDSRAWLRLGLYLAVVPIPIADLVLSESRELLLASVGAGVLAFRLLSVAVRHDRERDWHELGVSLGLAVLIGGLILATRTVAADLLALDGPRKGVSDAEPVAAGTSLQRLHDASWALLPREPLWSPLTGDDPLNAWRPLVGHGPETSEIVLDRHPSTPVDGSPDRRARLEAVYSQTLHGLVETGLVGAASVGIVLGTVLYAGARALGLVANRPLDRRLDSTSPMGPDLVVVTLVAAVVGYVISVQLGPANVATRSWFWWLAGSLVALAGRSSPTGGLPVAPVRADAARSGLLAPRSLNCVPVAATLVGLVVGTLALGVVDYRREIGEARVFEVVARALTTVQTGDGPRDSWGLLWLVLVTLTFAVGVALADRGRAPDRSGGGQPSNAIALVVGSCSIGVLLLVVHLLVARNVRTDQIAAGLSVFSTYLGLLFGLVALLAAFLPGTLPERRTLVANRLTAPASAVGVVVGLLVIRSLSLGPVHTDMLLMDIRSGQLDSQPEHGLALVQAIMNAHPARDGAWTELGGSAVTFAERAPDPGRRQSMLDLADEALGRARHLNPFDVGPLFALARLERLRADLADTVDDAIARRERSLSHHELVTRLAPGSASSWVRYAQALLDHSRYLERNGRDADAHEARRRAEQMVAQSLTLDPTFCLGFATRAQLRTDWRSAAGDAIDALTYASDRRLRCDGHVQETRRQAHATLAEAAEHAHGIGQSEQYLMLLETASEARAVADLFMALSLQYFRLGQLDLAVWAAESAVARAPISDTILKREAEELAGTMRRYRFIDRRSAEAGAPNGG